MRTPLIAANWKMNGTGPQASALLDELLPRIAARSQRPEVAIAPPFTLLQMVGERLRCSGVALAAQNLHPASHGAFTGEVSGAMLADLGVRYVIVGHSERRRLFGESDEDVARKVAAAAEAGLVPILCIGEEESQRLAGKAVEVLECQLKAGISRLGVVHSDRIVVAYEPVWAIGTGRTASGDQIVEAHRAIRGFLTEAAGPHAAAGIRVLYGGSATPESFPAIAAHSDVDGALVGGASLAAASFDAIVGAAPPGRLPAPEPAAG